VYIPKPKEAEAITATAADAVDGVTAAAAAAAAPAIEAPDAAAEASTEEAAAEPTPEAGAVVEGETDGTVATTTTDDATTPTWKQDADCFAARIYPGCVGDGTNACTCGSVMAAVARFQEAFPLVGADLLARIQKAPKRLGKKAGGKGNRGVSGATVAIGAANEKGASFCYDFRKGKCARGAECKYGQ
jgi:hypothetical protein